MKRARVLFAVRDLLFCERIEDYIQETKFPIELEIVTEPEYFDYSHVKTEIDILLITDTFLEKLSLNELPKDKVLVLTKESNPSNGLKGINPYQKTENFLKEILLRYSELTGEASFLQGEKKKKNTICFFSPCGGSGKTTLALALASALARAGKNVFYLSLDGFAGVNAAFSEPGRGGFSRVLLSLKQHAGNQLLVELSKNMKRALESGVLYFSDLDNPCDLDEIETEEIETLIREMVRMNGIDVLILDVEPALTERTKKVLELADYIFSPILDTPLCQMKVTAWREAAEVSNFLKTIRKKMAWVCNQSSGSLRYFNPLTEEFFAVPMAAALAGTADINRIGEILQNGVREMRTKVLEGCEER